MAQVTVAPCERWVRAWRGGKAVVDTRRARYVYGAGAPHAVWFVPRADVDPAALVPGDRPDDGLRAWPDPPHPDLADHLELRFDGFDAVTEEEQRVYGHPRDPLHRIDALPSARRVEVRLGDLLVAASDRPVALFETGLRPRWYLPWSDVRTDLLVPSERRSICPYKGFARYWSVQAADRVHRDLVWCYEAPFAGAEAIAGRLAFYTERADLRVT